MTFNTAEYWNRRLNEEFSLKGVGYINFSEHYNEWLYNRKTKVFEEIIGKHVGDLKHKRVLDIGCGTGFFVDKYVRRGAEVVGVDIADKSIKELSKKYPDSRFQVLDLAQKGGTVDGKFDVINMWDVMYHIVDHDKFIQACSNIAFMAAPGCHFIVTDFFGAEQEIRPAPHVTFRNEGMYRKILSDLGFELTKTYPLYRYLNRPYRFGYKLTNFLAPLLYTLDNFNNKIMSRNISVAVWRRK